MNGESPTIFSSGLGSLAAEKCVGAAYGVANAALPLQVHVPVGAAAGGTNQAIGHRCHLLSRASGPATFVPRVNAALGVNVKKEMIRELYVITTHEKRRY
jgi:hypothetical protein